MHSVLEEHRSAHIEEQPTRRIKSCRNRQWKAAKQTTPFSHATPSSQAFAFHCLLPGITLAQSGCKLLSGLNWNGNAKTADRHAKAAGSCCRLGPNASKLYPALMRRTATTLLVGLWPGETLPGVWWDNQRWRRDSRGRHAWNVACSLCKVRTEFVILHPLQFHK